VRPPTNICDRCDRQCDGVLPECMYCHRAVCHECEASEERASGCVCVDCEQKFTGRSSRPMGHTSAIKFKQPVFLNLPKGDLTAEDTGVLMWEEGQTICADAATRQTYDDLGIAYEVVAECDREELAAFIREHRATR